MSAAPAPEQALYDKVLSSAIPHAERLRLCLQCGTCSGICPYGFAMDFPPQSLIAQLRAEDLSPLYESDSVWLCMSCQSCTSVCPKQIPVTDGLMTTIKAEMMLRGKVPAELQSALENAFRYGNALGASPRKRADWTKGLDVPVMGSSGSRSKSCGTLVTTVPFTPAFKRSAALWRNCCRPWESALASWGRRK